MSMIKLGGISVDAADPCALYEALYLVKLKLITGEMTGEYSIQSPVTRETVAFSKPDSKSLNEEMDRLQAACKQATSGHRPSRRIGLKY